MPTLRRRRRVHQKVYDGSPPEVMDIKALAQYLGMGRSKIYALIRERKVPASRIGRQYRFSKTLVDAWLKERLITRSEDSQYPLFPKQK